MDSSVEEVSFEKGEECINIFMSYCGKMSEYYQENNMPTPPPEYIINLSMKVLVHWYLQKEELTEEELRTNQDFLQKVIAFTYRHREKLNIIN